MKNLDLNTYIRRSFDYSVVDTTVAAQARQAAERIRGHQRAAAVEIGRELLAMKEALPHGQFIPWVEAEFEFTRRTATNLMQVATEFGDESRWERVAHLPAAVLYQLAAPSTPAAVRETVLHLDPEQRASVSSVRHLIAESRTQEAKKERRAKAQNGPSPEDLAKERRREQREARERIKREAEIEAARQPVRVAVEVMREALGDRFAVFQESIRNLSAWDLKDVLLEVVEPNKAAA